MFVVTWLGAVLIWRYGHIEEKWGSTSAPHRDRDLGRRRAFAG